MTGRGGEAPGIRNDHDYGARKRYGDEKSKPIFEVVNMIAGSYCIHSHLINSSDLEWPKPSNPNQIFEVVDLQLVSAAVSLVVECKSRTILARVQSCYVVPIGLSLGHWPTKRIPDPQPKILFDGKGSNKSIGTWKVGFCAKSTTCPRCKSMETKFCYFNNYNVNQPRHFCKSCQRYWTAGGALRNVPVGAGRRKGKPPCSGDGGSPDGCVYETSDDGHEFGLALDKWHVATPQRDFRQVFPGKRRRTISGGYRLAFL